MLINHPLLGPRDSKEFTILGSAELLDRPDWQVFDAEQQFYEYVYLRDNPYGRHTELWYHQDGDRSWLVVDRDTVTHEIYSVKLASDVVRARQSKLTPQKQEAKNEP